MYDATARKPAINLTSNEQPLSQPRGPTDNLTNVVETLLAEYLGLPRPPTWFSAACVCYSAVIP